MLHTAANEIVAAADVARRASIASGNDSRVAPCGAVSTDDLLPLFIAAIVQVCLLLWVQQTPCPGLQLFDMQNLTALKPFGYSPGGAFAPEELFRVYALVPSERRLEWSHGLSGRLP